MGPLHRGRQTEAHGHGGTDIGGVVPAQPAERFGELLEPTVVGETPVEDGGIRPNDELSFAAGRGGARRGVPVVSKADALFGQARAGHDTVVQSAAPRRFKVAAVWKTALAPSGTHDIVGRPLRLSREERE